MVRGLHVVPVGRLGHRPRAVEHQDDVGAHLEPQDVEGIDFSIFHRNVEVAIFRKHACVNEFIFWLLFPAIAICFEQIFIGVGAMWIFIQGFHV